ncbi:MAG TPA: FkbM family methyltransferase [Ignavibacteriaceae bacterium]|nr:FkbM family methyltransferase [Ignavibacteriaceae bacterium]
MNGYLNKFLSSIKSRGISQTLRLIADKISFETKYMFTSFKLNTIKTFTKGELTVNHGKYKFNFYGGGDRGEILYHAFWDKMFDEDKNKIKNFVHEGDTIIDVGGNLGFFVLILTDLINDSGKIYSFEPSNRLNKKLASTIRINNLKNVEIINLALGEAEGSTTLHYNPKQSGLSSIVSDFEENSLSEEIKITTLNKFSENIPGRVSFIKIDTEGYEPQVLRGAKELIFRDKPTIYIELGGEYQASSADALKILNELNYFCEAENLDLKTIPAGVNFIATPRN